MSGARILVDARLPWGSGIGRYVRNILPPVAERLTAARFTLLVAGQDRERAATAMAGSANVAVRPSAIRPFSLAEQWRLPALAGAHDLTWFTNYWVPLRWPGRFVATVHDLIHLDAGFPAGPARRFASARTFAGVQRGAAHVIFVSRFTAGEFARRVGPPRAASIVHHGIDHEGTLPVADDRPRERFALVVAAAKEHKNLPLLLGAWRDAALPSWRLTIVTPGDDLRSGIDLAGHAAGIAGVGILSGIADADLAALYARAGFVIVPSRYEGFGLPLLEAMRAGAPVLSSTAPALVEVAGETRIPLVAPYDRAGWTAALRTMAAGCGPSSAEQATSSARNRDHAARFTWDRAADRTAAILGQALQQR